MIEKIYIPTVHRVNNQITYSNLPKDLQTRVVMVVQAWERSEYAYNCEYLVLPDTHDFHYTNHFCVANTRLYIYQVARFSKYALFDDDIQFKRRNARYITGVSNMELSKRTCTDNDILEMFELYDYWLNTPSVTVAGCSLAENPPASKRYSDNSGMAGAFWINGHDFANELDSWVLNDVVVGEDDKFLLTLLSNGYGTRLSQEFCTLNRSIHKKSMPSTIWDSKTPELVHESHKKLAESFPGIYNVLYNDVGERIPGGFRDYGKTIKRWSKAFNKQRHLNVVSPRLVQETKERELQ